MIGSPNGTGATRASAHFSGSLKHRTNDFRMLRHSKIIVRAPYFSPRTMRMPNCVGETSNYSLDIDEYAITPLPVKPIQCTGKEVFVIQMRTVLHSGNSINYPWRLVVSMCGCCCGRNSIIVSCCAAYAIQGTPANLAITLNCCFPGPAG